MRTRTVLCIGLLTVLCGCSLHTPMQPTPSSAVPDRYSRSLTASDLGLDQPWWNAFTDPQLDELMQGVLQDNLELEQALARVRQAEASRKIAGASRWPTLTAEGDASRSRSVSGTVGDTTGLSAAAAWEVDLWGRLRAQSRAADQRFSATRQDLRGLYVSLSARLADAYFLWQEQQAQLALTEKTIASNADTLKRVERRYRAGLTGALDVYQSRQNLAPAQAARAGRTQALVEAGSTLSLLLGRFPEEPFSLETRSIPMIEVPWGNGLSATLLLQRPDIQAAALRLRALDAGVEAAIADRLPALSLGASVGYSRSTTTGVTLSDLVWNLFTNLTAPLIDGGRRSAEVDRSRAAVEESLAAYRQTLLEAAREVEDALSAAEQNRLRVEGLQREATAADASLRLSTDNYFQGLSDYLEVLSAQRFQFDARSRLLTARRELVSSQVGLARALGGSWTEPWMTQRHSQAVLKGE